MKRDSYGQLLIKLNGLLRAAKGHEVVEQLQQLEARDVPRQFVADFAELARRSNLHLLSMKFLNGIVRPQRLLAQPATGKELANYGASLLALGATKEAKSVLSQVDAKLNPEVYLFRAFLMFGEWNYGGAIPFLKNFIQSESNSEYRRLVGQVNLCAAYVNSGHRLQAEELLREVQEITSAKGFHLLLGNSLEIHSQLHIFNQNYDQALLKLSEAQATLSTIKGWNSFMVKKWSAICHVMISGGATVKVNDNVNGKLTEKLRELKSLRTEAVSLRHWETLRDLDLFEFLATGNQKLLDHLITGTPFKHYRQRVSTWFQKQVQIPREFDWVLAPDIQEVSTAVLDVGSGGLETEVENLSSQPILHQALLALSRDFYKPASLGQLFSDIYPREYFNPTSSPQRLVKTLYRLNDYFCEKKIPLTVLTAGGDFHLMALGPIRLRLRSRQVLKPKLNLLVAKLHQVIGPKSFDNQFVVQVLHISKTSASRVIGEALKTKKVIKIGNGRSTRYRFSRARIAA